MATNVTEKDKALQEVIDWLKDQLDQEQDSIHCAQADGTCDDLIGDSVIRALTFAKCIKHCRSMLGYSGSMPSCLNYEDIDDSSPDLQPQVGDYGVAVLENAHGQEEIPFHVEREEHTGLPVALLNTRLYAKPEDDIDDGQYVSLFQLYLDGFMLSRTGRKRNKDAKE